MNMLRIIRTASATNPTNLREWQRCRWVRRKYRFENRVKESVNYLLSGPDELLAGELLEPLYTHHNMQHALKYHAA
jgi:hypothetical protein